MAKKKNDIENTSRKAVSQTEKADEPKKRGRRKSVVENPETEPAEPKVRRPRRTKAQKALDEVQQQLNDLIVKRDRYLGEVQVLTNLLSAFGILTNDGDVEVRTPEKGTQYFYLFKSMTHHPVFEVKFSNWMGGFSDLFRFTDGNIYLDETVAVRICHAKNMYMRKLAESNIKK